jgi:glycosyltransferase A (GT-A) superfamily protein (DUF2064 family)
VRLQNGRTILLFTRAPEAEARAKRLPIAEGTRLFAGFLKSWQQRAADTDAELFVVAPASSEIALTRLLPESCVATQIGASFAERMESAFAAAFDRGANAVLMVGGDGPPLDIADIRDAFSHLESAVPALVLAPASDGGVNAIGFNANAERTLAAIAWHGSDVCRQLQSEAIRFNLSLLLTSPGHDLDCAGNVATLYRLSRGEPGWSAFRWLLLSVLLACRMLAAPVKLAVSRFSGRSGFTRGPPLSPLLSKQT